MRTSIRSILLSAATMLLYIPSFPARAGACHSAPHSNIGCEFYAVTLPNAFTDQSSYAFGVRALNPSATTTANLGITGGGLATSQNHPISPGAASDLTLPWVNAVSTATGTVLVAGGAYHLVSDSPLSVVQFNTDSAASQSNDATLLMPVQNAGTSFLANAWPEWENIGIGQEQPAQIAVIATVSPTSVQISAHNLQAGGGLSATGGTAQLNAGDVLLLSSALSGSVDISGMRIDSSAPILVFSAHAGTYVPSGAAYADHLEDSVPPLTEAGQDYLLVRPSSPTGGNDAKQYVRLTGTVDGTNLSFDPVVAGAPSSLNAGQTVGVELFVDVHLHADQPIISSQFMEGSQAFANNTNYIGDPSQLTSIPSNRGAIASDFIAPSALASIFAQVIAPSGTQVTLDGSAVSGWQAIGSSGYSGANVALCCSDVHHATAAQPFTLSVYAYPAIDTTSYWYAGQLGPSDDIFGDGF
jgi:hypothetical protein